jgi:hypothetical protein
MRQERQAGLVSIIAPVKEQSIKPAKKRKEVEIFEHRLMRSHAFSF